MIESPLLAWVRDFLTSDDVLCMHTTGIKWNIARLYGLFAELIFFLLMKEGTNENPTVLQNGQVCDTTTDN